MDEAERSSLVEQLRGGLDSLLRSVEGLSDAQARFKPGPEQWSIEDIVEHLAVTEHGMYRLITAYYEPLAEPADRGREEMVANLGRDRSKKRDAPERVRPRGRYATLAAALEQFRANRERTIAYVAGCEDDLRTRATEHPLGRMSCQECLMVLIGHPLRHLEQIREIKQSPRYPA